MNRRPWPLVFLAFFQLFAPFVSVGLSARVNDVGYIEMMNLIWTRSSPLQITQLFVLPIAMGLLIFYARRMGYFLIIAMILFNVYSNMSEWFAAGDPSNLGLMIAVNVSVILLLIYLLLPQTRAVFFDQGVRWWEADPRFLLTVPARLTHDGVEREAILFDLSRGGACIEGEKGAFVPGEVYLLEFTHGARTCTVRTHMIYERAADSPGISRFGLQWANADQEGEASITELCQELKKAKHPRSRVPAPWKEDLKQWIDRARRSPKAWAPEVKPRGPKT